VNLLIKLILTVVLDFKKPSLLKTNPLAISPAFPILQSENLAQL